MKTRIGFVSNSSSSSFILKLKNEKQFEKKLNDLVKFLAEDRMDWEDSEADKKKEYNKVMNAYKRLKRLPAWKDIMSGKVGIQFPSCNYDTYIIKVEGEEEQLFCATSHHVRSFSLDNNWIYIDEDGEDSDLIGCNIRNASFVSFNRNFKVMTHKEIDDDWEVKVNQSDVG